MKPTSFLLVTLCFLPLSLTWSAGNAWAQLDRVYDNDGGNVGGTITLTSKDGVQLKKGGSVQNFLSSDILKIMYEGDPEALTKAREFALDGQWQQALAELKNVNFAQIKRPVIKAEYGFFLVLCQSKFALAGKGNKKEAAAATLKFLTTYRDSWHFYEATKVLGDLALALNDHANALKYYGALAQSPSTDTKIDSVYLTGLVHLNKGDAEAAKSNFDKVIGLQPQTPMAVRLQTLSKAGKAVALARDGQGAEGLKMVGELIAQLSPTDTEMAARIYNAQGASYEASGDKEGAVMAYLHTHLMFATQPDAHAEALKKLTELWPQIGKPERAAQARQELQERYPGF
jgi:tetratricopeptide (TPR) repeat protein